VGLNQARQDSEPEDMSQLAICSSGRFSNDFKIPMYQKKAVGRYPTLEPAAWQDPGDSQEIAPLLGCGLTLAVVALSSGKVDGVQTDTKLAWLRNSSISAFIAPGVRRRCAASQLATTYIVDLKLALLLVLQSNLL
jgi:hypothetical protein